MHFLIFFLTALCLPQLWANGEPDSAQSSEAGIYVQAKSQFDISNLDPIGLYEEAFYGPNADFIKVHFAHLNLPDGVTVEVSNPSGSESYHYSNQSRDAHTYDSLLGENGKTSFGAMSISGDTAVVRLIFGDKVGPVNDTHAIVISQFLAGNVDAESAPVRFLLGNRWCSTPSSSKDMIVLEEGQCINQFTQASGMEIWIWEEDSLVKEAGLSFLGGMTPNEQAPGSDNDLRQSVYIIHGPDSSPGYYRFTAKVKSFSGPAGTPVPVYRYRWIHNGRTLFTPYNYLRLQLAAGAHQVSVGVSDQNGTIIGSHTVQVNFANLQGDTDTKVANGIGVNTPATLETGREVIQNSLSFEPQTGENVISRGKETPAAVFITNPPVSLPGSYRFQAVVHVDESPWLESIDNYQYRWNHNGRVLFSRQNYIYLDLEEGSHDIALTVLEQNNQIVGHATKRVSVSAPGNQPPHANFSFSSDGLEVDFSNSSSDPENDVLTWDWNFGQGSAGSSAENPSFEYDAPGSYSVTLTVTDSSGAVDSITKTVSVTKAGLTGYISNGSIWTPGAYDFRAIVNNSVGTVHYQWFKDEVPVGVDSYILHTDILCPTVIKLVSWDDCSEFTSEKLILVQATNNQNPVASFGYSVNGNKVTFVNGSYDPDGYITRYTWDFGDGVSSQEVSPTHHFSSGAHTVTLTVRDNACGINSQQQTITVGASPLEVVLKSEALTPDGYYRISALVAGGVPLFQYTWWLNDVRLWENGSYFEDFLNSGFNTFRCTVYDRVGNQATKTLRIWVRNSTGGFPVPNKQ